MDVIEHLATEPDIFSGAGGAQNRAQKRVNISIAKHKSVECVVSKVVVFNMQMIMCYMSDYAVFDF